MSRIGLLGGAYTSQSVAVDSQSCVNLVVERDESQAGKSEGILPLRPGLKNFAPEFSGGSPAAGGPCGGLITTPNGRVFSLRNENVGGVAPYAVSLYEIKADGSATYGGQLYGFSNPIVWASPVRWAVNNRYVAFIGPAPFNVITCFDYTLPFPLVTFGSAITDALSHIVFFDGYFLALKANSAQVYYTLDVTNWNLANTFAVSITADYVHAMIVDHRELWLLGDIDTVVYYDAGDLLNPFQPNPSGFIQQGIGAAASLVQLDNTLLWLGKDDKGQGIAWRANGYRPERISTFAIEAAWASYATIADAVGYPVQIQGHSFWVIYFPTANKTWVYDVASGLWGEWNHWKNDGTFEAHRSWVQAFAFGKHLVGDWKTGNIYEMAFAKSNGAGGWLFCDDFGDPIQWQRRFPYVAQENERLFHQILEVDLETGLGPVPPLVGAIPGNQIAQLFWTNGAAPTIPAGDWAFVSVQLDNPAVVEQGLLTIPVGVGINVTLTLPNPYTATGWTVFGSPDNWATVYAWNIAGPLIAPATGANLNFGETGNGVFPFYREPQINLRLSDDRGHSYGNLYARDCGQAGEYSKRVRWTRLGASRFRVYELSGSDPIPWRLVDAYLDAPPGFSKGTPRLSEKLRQQA